MHRRSLTITTTLSIITPFAAIALMSSDAEAATPTFYNNAGVYQAGLGPSVTDDYSNPGYTFPPSMGNAQMSAVLGQTDYQSTGFGAAEINIVTGGAYCAGCNGSFRLIFTSTTVGNAQGVYGVGMNITVNAGNPQYTAFITYGDGTTQNVLLPLGASYWAVSAPERITSVHFGLPDAGTTNQGSFQIDNLQIGASPNEVCDGQALNVAALVPGSGASIQQLGSTVGALNNINEDVEIACYEFSSAAEHVYQFSLPVDTFLQVNTSGSNYDTKMAVVQGCPDGDTFCLYDDDIGGGDVDSSVPCTEYPAGGYSVVITGFNGATGNYVLNVTECQPCGNGVVDPGEDCDDDGESATCDVDCTNATCGDGYTNLLANEVCDTAGETIACDSDCTAPACGDGLLNMTAGEACDDGGESAACNANCTVAQCGDGITNAAAGEECDDSGESVDCDDDCSAVQCGDSNVNETAGETCDDGGRSAACNADCTAASCGDGILNAAAGEECDGDGQGTPGQTATCDADCTNAMCGDGVLNDDAGEECDDGGDSKTCDADCTAASCGDGTINEALAEECDDGNTDDDDGCSAACEIEEAPGTSSGGEESSSGGEEESSGGTTDATDTSEDTSGPSTETDPTDADTSGSASGSGSVSDTNDEDDTSATNDDDGDETTSEGATGGTADEGGCGCTTDDRRGNAWSVLALFGLGALVRRRRRA